MISGQQNTGQWSVSHLPALAGAFKGGQTEDTALRQAIEALADSLMPEADKQTIYTTLVAIYVLTEGFAEQEDEWTLLVRKAKAYLREQGVEKPDKLLRLFTLEVVVE